MKINWHQNPFLTTVELDEDAVYSYGWKYSSVIQEIELVDE